MVDRNKVISAVGNTVARMTMIQDEIERVQQRLQISDEDMQHYACFLTAQNLMVAFGVLLPAEVKESLLSGEAPNEELNGEIK